tara:strand:+ start:372 stop:668 length:297 start_codon:yes stop_codon:yes gene_type:complete
MIISLPFYLSIDILILFTAHYLEKQNLFFLNESVLKLWMTISHVMPGTVQLTPGGKIIILMRDCQTTGGYPRILQLTNSAINILSQKMTNSEIKFNIK